MKPTIYTIQRDALGTLSTMAHPSGGDQLATEMASLRERGVDILVCALTADEQEELDLREEREAAEAAGLEFHWVPIGDLGIPDRTAVTPLLAELAGELRAGRHVVTHCWAGIGRSSLLAAGILVQDGVPRDEAWSLISAARGRRVPETEAQRTWP